MMATMQLSLVPASVGWPRAHCLRMPGIESWSLNKTVHLVAQRRPKSASLRTWAFRLLDCFLRFSEVLDEC
jgi:hypothetical protein